MSYELNDTDREILEFMLEGRSEGRPWGRHVPTLISDEVGYSRQYIGLRLQLLEAAGLVETLGSGLREITEQGVEVAEEEGLT